MFAGLASVACQLRERTSRTIRFAAAGEPLTKPKKGREVARRGEAGDIEVGNARSEELVEHREAVGYLDASDQCCEIRDAGQVGPLTRSNRGTAWR